MRPLTHAAWLAFGLAAPTLLTFWSISDSGPRNKAHYERVAAERTDTRAVVERLVKTEGPAGAEIAADGEVGLILNGSTATLVRVKDGKITERRDLADR